MKAIDGMYQLFGRGNGKCKNCSHLCSYTANRTWYKCEIWGVSSSESSDWRLSYDACGLFNRPRPETFQIEAKEYFKRQSRAKEEIEGQIGLF